MHDITPGCATFQNELSGVVDRNPWKTGTQTRCNKLKEKPVMDPQPQAATGER